MHSCSALTLMLVRISFRSTASWFLWQPFEDVLLFFSTEQSMWLSNNLSNGLQVATSGHASILELFTLVEHVYILR